MAPAWLHGECVSVGMVKETEVARGSALHSLAPDALSRLVALLVRYRLPVHVPPEVCVSHVCVCVCHACACACVCLCVVHITCV